MAQDLRAREMREALGAFTEDHAVLTEHMHAARAAREDAERDVAATKAQRDTVRSDWARKLQDRRKEVHLLSLDCLVLKCLSSARSPGHSITLRFSCVANLLKGRRGHE